MSTAPKESQYKLIFSCSNNYSVDDVLVSGLLTYDPNPNISEQEAFYELQKVLNTCYESVDDDPTTTALIDLNKVNSIILH